jgi:hypothetical protein
VFKLTVVSRLLKRPVLGAVILVQRLTLSTSALEALELLSPSKTIRLSTLY